MITICADCRWSEIVPEGDLLRYAPEAWVCRMAAGRCLVTGQLTYADQVTRCLDKNDGDCPDFEPKGTRVVNWLGGPGSKLP